MKNAGRNHKGIQHQRGRDRIVAGQQKVCDKIHEINTFEPLIPIGTGG